MLSVYVPCNEFGYAPSMIHTHMLCMNLHSNPEQQKIHVCSPVVLSCVNVNAGYDGLRGQEACQRHAWHLRCCVTQQCSSAQS